MIDLTIDWAWLYLQIGILAFVAGRELARRRNRNLYAILIPTAFLVLMQGQAWWALRQIEITHQPVMEQLYNTFDLPAVRRANLYIGLGVIGYAIAFWLSRSLAGRARVEAERSVPWIAPGTLSYILAAAWTVGTTVLLVTKVGGLNLAIAQPGRMIEGQTVFIIAVGLAKWPLIHKIVSRQAINWPDVGLWSVAVVVTLFNSRFLTAFAVVQLGLVVNYCRRELSRKLLLSMAAPAIGIFIVFGIYRDYAFRFGTVGAEAAQEFLRRPEEWNVADWFYRTNVEGFTGLAGALAYQNEGRPFDYDFGASELAVFTKLIPNSIRTDPRFPFTNTANFLEGAYPYSASVVPSGIELSYGHWGLGGVLAYCALLGLLTQRFNTLARARDPAQLRNLVLSAQLLNSVRASLFFSVVFFGLGDLVTLWLYRSFIRVNREVALAIAPSSSPIADVDVRP